LAKKGNREREREMNSYKILVELKYAITSYGSCHYRRVSAGFPLALFVCKKSWTNQLGCQMLYMHTKNPNLGILWRAYELM
jgi:hypothetical protein